MAHIFESLITRDWNSLTGLKGLRGVAFLEQVCHWGWSSRFQKPMTGLVSLCLCLSTFVHKVIAQLLLQHHAFLLAATLTLSLCEQMSTEIDSWFVLGAFVHLPSQYWGLVRLEPVHAITVSMSTYVHQLCWIF